MGNQLYLPIRIWEAMIGYKWSKVTEGAEMHVSRRKHWGFELLGCAYTLSSDS